MAEGGVTPEEAGLAVQEKEVHAPKDLVGQLREKYVQAMRMREPTADDFYRRGQTIDARAEAAKKMGQEIERIKGLKEAAKDEISGQLASSILTAAPADRSILLDGIKDITGLRFYEGKGINAQHLYALNATVDLMSRTMAKMVETSNPQPLQK